MTSERTNQAPAEAFSPTALGTKVKLCLQPAAYQLADIKRTYRLLQTISPPAGNSNILMWLLRPASLKPSRILFFTDPALFSLNGLLGARQTCASSADGGPSPDELLHPEAGARACFSGTLCSLPLRQRRPGISGQHLMMQRRYCAFAAEQKSQRHGFWARAALEQRHPHSPALPPLGPLARRDELKPRAGSGNVMY